MSVSQRRDLDESVTRPSGFAPRTSVDSLAWGCRRRHGACANSITVPTIGDTDATDERTNQPHVGARCFEQISAHCGAEHDGDERAHLENAVCCDKSRTAASPAKMPNFAGLKNVACSATRNKTA